jgi:hypothetical protein
MKTTTLAIIFLFTSLFSTAAISKSYTKKQIYDHHTKVISKMIKAVQPQMSLKKRNQIALKLYKASRKFSVDPKIMVAIISTESSFRNNVVSSTGDISLAQINTVVWDKEFARLGLGKIDIKLLKKDETYALNKMGKILSILKKRHAKKDNQWYARYHSKTKVHKDRYSNQVETRLRKIASVNL